MSNRSWVTLATNDSYGLGALVLAHSLRRVGSVYPAVVLITPSVTEAMRERLRAVFAEVVTVDVLDSGDAAHLALLQRPELGITFTKIHCWSLTQYEKCVFLDADILVVQNCDELFEREELSAAPDVGWPDCFNSGVFVFKPSAETFDSLIKFAQERGSFDGGDQGLLNSYFSDWAHGDINKHLPFLYNVTSAAFYSYLPALKHYGQNLKIIHFIGAAKPWLQQFNFESRHVDAPDHLREFLQLWWDLFVSQVHSNLDISMVEVEVQHQGTVDNPPVFPPQDVNQHFHYQPVLDPESEFPWHRPEAQAHEEMNIPQIDMSDFHDPWDIYRGHIPPITDESNSNRSDKRVEGADDIRKYVWEYQAHEYTQNSGFQSQQNQAQNHEHSHYDSQQHYRGHNTEPVYIQEQNTQHHWHNFQHDQTQFHENNNEKHGEQSDFDYYEPSHWRQEQPYPEYPKHDFVQNPSLEHSNNQHSTEQSAHTHSESQTHNNQEFHSQSSQDFCDYRNDHEHKYHSQTNKTYHSHDFSSSQHNTIDTYIGDKNHIKTDKTTNFCDQVIRQQEVEVHHIHVEHGTNPNHQLKDGMINGDISDSECDIEDIRPRHPYDGYYLRHRVTIDSRGRKICSHEIPPPPSPSSSESPTPQDYFSAEDTSSDYEDQTGVAGNLARVALGGGQRDAIDDLTRRQGWEAGNIDYMGVDAFENIWAKISQTLSQPRQSPSKQSPSREPAPPAVQPTEVRQEPVAPEIEVAKEALPIEAPVVPKEISAPVKSVAPVAPSETALPVATPAEVPVVVDTPVKSIVSSPAKVPDVVPEVVATAPVPIVPVSKTVAAVVEIPESEVPVPVEAIEQVLVPKQKTETPAAAAVEAPKSTAAVKTTPASPTLPKAAGSPAVPEVTPEKASAADVTSDSPPLANTPSKEEASVAPAAKSAERRKPAGKLQLGPPAAPDPLPTPDSELEDAAALAHAIIASELRTPAVTAPSPTAPSPPPPAEPARLAAPQPDVPTPPVGAVALSQIGVKTSKGKATTAARIESSLTEKAEPPTPVSPTVEAPATAPTPTVPAATSDAPKKKVVKKVVKKEGAGSAGGADAPVPPPRKKEKKPKEK